MKNLVPDIHDYFLPNGHKKTLNSFLKTLPNYVIDSKDGVEQTNYLLALQVSKLCNFLVNEGLLINTSYNPMICTENEYVSVPINGFDEPEKLRHDITYGAYDFKFNGFASVFEEFKESVVPIEGINSNEDHDIGTAFYIGDNMFVTAAHCVTNLERFNLLNGETPICLKEVWLAKDISSDIYDLAIVIADEALSMRPFMLDDSKVLDSVLVMGYPPIPGMNPVLISETASISTDVQRLMTKSATGQVVTDSTSYMSSLDYFIINARVKGGNSGSPVINEYGKVIGTVFELPFDSLEGSQTGRYDIMGFGVCLPSKYIEQLCENKVSHKLKNEGEYYRYE